MRLFRSILALLAALLLALPGAASASDRHDDPEGPELLAALEARGDALLTGIERGLAEEIRDAVGDPVERALAGGSDARPAGLDATAWRAPCSFTPGGVLECLVPAGP